MSNRMIIDSSHPEETRAVVVKGNRLEEFDFESQHKKQIRGNIYLAKVTRVEPSLQAAFVDYGGNRHGFLAFSEIHPDYYQIPLADRQALLDEEAAQAETDFDDDEDDGDNGRGRKGRRRRGRGRRNGKSQRRETQVPDAEPVAMDDILAALDDEDEDEDGGDARAARADNGDTVSEDAAASDDGDDEDSDFEDVGEDDALEESRPRRRPSRRQYKIQEVIKRRQVILVQVVKEERGNKGAALTTYLSLAGRYSVLMPNTARGGGISRKITTVSDRKRLKDLVRKLDVPKGMGVILRTAGANRTQAEIERDYDYLMRLWDNVRDLTLSSSAPSLVYEEGSLIKRSIRDLYNKDIDEIIVAGEDGYREAKDFMKMLMPSQAKAVKPWRETAPILARTGIEAQLDKLIQPQVTLKSGGYIIINQTEALVAIDVNSGKSTREHSIEETALATNLEAAEEVARQLRLRDLAGLIVIDFIDMDENRNNRAVEKKLKDCLKHDRARIQVGRISHFGLLEMSRQRMRASVLESTMSVCPACNGTGYVRSPQSVALHVIRSLEEHLLKNSKHHVTVRTQAATALYVLNNKRDTLVEMEGRFGVKITIEMDDDIGAEMFAIEKGAISDLPKIESPAIGIGLDEDDDEDAVAAVDVEVETTDEEDEDRPRRKRRRGRRGRDKDGEDDGAESRADAADDGEDDDEQSGGRRRKRRSRGRRGGRNRRDRGPRIPDAEPVGPLADLIAAEAHSKTEEQASAEARQDTDTESDAPETSQESVPVAEQAGEPTQAADVVEAVDSAPEGSSVTAEDVPAPANDDADGDAASGSEAEETPARKRATAANLNLDVEPVVVSETDKSDDEKPKRAGWWARGKSFF
ncbi:ribonuclease E/G [Oceaniradius stylonematis]|uniref:Ribonuclease E n=1 Tax=Oceaniradius stylonematis TaxID=2184161 RepID=A0A3A8AKK2_9HYPH|nr:ribonuclease E/G [Oceaniradius stylonematis]RKF06383.1 ribonuclease E/G [Oceaniradius stylonematis]